jgi:serine phosphatase RsbU (regulator of sigma subunit)
MDNEQINDSEKPKGYVKLQTKLGISFTIVVIFTSALLTISLYLISRRAVHEGIRKQLHNAVGIAALQIDGDVHSKITSLEDEDDPEYRQIQRQLQRIRDLDPDIRFAETMRLKPNKDIVFVVDAETDPKEIIHFGTVYDTASPLFSGSVSTLDRPLVEPHFITDEWGTWITGYAPFYTSDGRREGFVVMDIAATRVKGHERRFLWIALIIFAIMALISPVFGFWIGRRMSVSIVKLTDGAKRIAGGDLDIKVEVDSRDEYGDLADAFNKMAEDLKQYIKDLQETTAAKERIEADLRIAHDIQINILPRVFPPFPDRGEFDIFAYIEPAREVGGDLYDFFFIDENKFFFLIGDVSGKGVPAALFMMITKAVIKSEAMRGSSPKEILYKSNNIICSDNDASMFVTVFCAILDIETGELEYGNAGHNPPLIYRSGQDYEYIDVEKTFVFGPMPDMEFAGGKFKLSPDDVIFLYTDGVTEAMNAQKRLFSEQRLQKALSDLKGGDIEEILPGVRESMREFVEDEPQSDDITMLALKFNG